MTVGNLGMQWPLLVDRRLMVIMMMAADQYSCPDRRDDNS